MFQRGCRRLVRNRDIHRHTALAARSEFSESEGGGTNSVTGVTDDKVTVYGKCEDDERGRRLVSRADGGFDGVRSGDVRKERKAAAEATEDSQKICEHFAKKQSADGSCSFIDAHKLCNFVRTEQFRRIVKVMVAKEAA